MSATSTNYSNTAMEAAFNGIKATKTELEKYNSQTSLTETDMIKYNLAVSQYSTMVSLASGLVKNISDTEKQVANKM